MNWQLYPATAFARHAGQWQALNLASQRSALLHPDFVQALVDQFATQDDWLAICQQEGNIVAMTLLRQRRGGRWNSFQPSQQPLALWLHHPHAPLAALLHGLLRALPGWPLVCNLTQFDPALVARPAEPDLHCVDALVTARLTIQGSFDDYWQARSRNLRNNLGKQRKRLQREGIVPRLEVVREEAAVAQAIADYGRLESSGWKGREGTAVHADNAQGHFYRKMLEAFCRRGQGCILRYWFGEQLAAMNLCIEDGDSLIVLKTSYDEQLEGHYSPAFLLREDTLRQLFAEGRPRRLEFYGRTMEWHLRWTDEVRTMYHLTHYRWQLLGWLHTQLRVPALPQNGSHKLFPN
ncbi:GNAT family N-acetyltransferase [Pseudoduganella eburnea]|uniref:GNAT family N-acetyltransferase n=1 Tax=Massilia eburnea TaxID=1776165 RepID=A0A6L6QSD5_9BURK|nr:GNAT family N-acetyltransferase [Massilia eburnea]MTW14353.1 GNAT family N-acetyltransferase [Massilia eburnea]